MNRPPQSLPNPAVPSSLQEILLRDDPERFPLRAEYLSEIASILAVADHPQRSALLRLAGALPAGERLVGFSPLRWRTEDEVLGFFRLLAWRPGSELRLEMLAALENLDELSLCLLEATGRERAGDLRPLLRDVLCRRKLSLEWVDWQRGMDRALSLVFDEMCDVFLPRQPECFRTLLARRLAETEEILKQRAEEYTRTVDEELFESPSLDLYLLVMRFLDRAWRRLPVEDVSELGPDAPEGDPEEYASLLEAMYTRLAGRLAGELIRSLTPAADEE